MSTGGPSSTRAVVAGVDTTAADAPPLRAGVRVPGDAGAGATLSAPAGGGRRPPSRRRSAATDAPTAKAGGCAVAADPAVGLATWRPRAAAGAAGAIAGAATTDARQPDCGPPAVASPARVADRLRGGAGDAAAPGGATDRPRAAAPDSEADRPRADACVSDAAGGRPVARPPPTAASVPDTAAVLPVLVVAAAALSALPAVATAATLSLCSTRVTTRGLHE